MPHTVDLYYFAVSPPCRCVMLVARAVGVDLNLKTVNLMEGEHMTPEFIKMNPQHTIPTLNDNDLILWESRAILCYLVDMYAKDSTAESLYPKDVKKRAIVNQRLYFDACSLFGNLAAYFVPVMSGNETTTDDMKKLKFEESLDTLEKFLEGQEWVAGDNMTIADISILVTVGTAEAIGINVDRNKGVSEWLKRCKKEMGKYGYEDIEKTAANMFGQFFRNKLK